MNLWSLIPRFHESPEFDPGDSLKRKCVFFPHFASPFVLTAAKLWDFVVE